MLLRRWRIAASLVGILAGVTKVVLAKEAGHDWEYAGAHDPQHWGDVKAEYATCASGKNQSPIDIRSTVPTDLESITFDYHASPLNIIDNGHTIQVNYSGGVRSRLAVSNT